MLIMFRGVGFFLYDLEKLHHFHPVSHRLHLRVRSHYHGQTFSYISLEFVRASASISEIRVGPTKLL